MAGRRCGELQATLHLPERCGLWARQRAGVLARSISVEGGKGRRRLKGSYGHGLAQQGEAKPEGHEKGVEKGLQKE